MDILRVQDLQNLINLEQHFFISIYMPTFSSGVDIRQNPVKFKQLLRKAESKLYDFEMRKEEVETFLKLATNLVGETKFWQNQSEGLAIFIYADGMKYFRLPFKFKESVTVSNKIYVKPLLPLFTGNGQFNILALSKNEVRLFRCTRQNIIEIELEDAPDNMYDMQVDDDAKTNLLIRTSNTVGPNQLVYNKVTQGQGNEIDYERKELTRYFRAIDKSLLNMEYDENIPLVLAGVEYLIPIYREKSNYPYIVEDFIRGNPEILSPEELHQKAWEIVEPIFTKDQKQAQKKYSQYCGQDNELYLNNLEKIIPAAFNGQIESLFLDNSISKWGKFDHATNKVQFHKEEKNGNEDLMEYACILTLSRGGKVFAVDKSKVPDENHIAAVLRY
ncbi:hypothetical protein [Wansuia hejianensis]|uniref:Uncharacterized protein n=1 Tax=Wansuia hejianensis TaxID=2763667 RepID=A0A926IP90_9FIRM|nr:hypothetical protein [Wansuia hejianensis]MBC8591433.1 hypothetical protein [Wansuia hejianensis]